MWDAPEMRCNRQMQGGGDGVSLLAVHTNHKRRVVDDKTHKRLLTFAILHLITRHIMTTYTKRDSFLYLNSYVLTRFAYLSVFF